MIGLAGAMGLVLGGLARRPPVSASAATPFLASVGVRLPVVAPASSPPPVAATATIPATSEPDSLLATPLPKALRFANIVTVTEAFADLAGMPPSAERTTRLATLFGFCCKRDPAEAANIAQDFPDRGLRDEATTFVLRLWAEGDPAAALSWANSQPRSVGDRSNYYAAFEGYAGTTPSAAMLFLNAPHLARDWERLTSIVIESLAAHGALADACAWVDELPAGDLRQLMTLRIAQKWGAKAPVETARWLGDLSARKSGAVSTEGSEAFLRTLAQDGTAPAAQHSEPKTP